MATDRDLALRYLGDCLYGAILGQAGAVRPSDLVRSLPRGMRLSVALIRQLLGEDARFEEFAGRFDIANRQAVKTRPFGGAVAALLESHERPVPIPLMVTALARIRGGSPDYFGELLDKYEASRDDVRYIADQVVHSDWVLTLAGEDEQQVLFFNRLDRDEDLQELWQECEKRDLRKRDPGLTAANILATFDRPIGPRQLAFLTWRHHPQIFDPVEFVEQALERDDIIPACGMWFGEGMIEALHGQLQEASDEVAGETEESVRVNLAEILAQQPPSTRFKLDPVAQSSILSVVSGAQVPMGIDELIVDILEVAPDSKRFLGAAHALEAVLSDEEGLIRLSPGRYLSRQAIPEWVHEVPEPLIPARTDADEDVLIELDALPEELRALVLDPVYEDVAAGVSIEPE